MRRPVTASRSCRWSGWTVIPGRERDLMMDGRIASSKRLSSPSSRSHCNPGIMNRRLNVFPTYRRALILILCTNLHRNSHSQSSSCNLGNEVEEFLCQEKICKEIKLFLMDSTASLRSYQWSRL